MKLFCKGCLFCSLLFSLNMLSAQSCGSATTASLETNAEKACCDVRDCPPGCKPENCAELVSNKTCTPAQVAACQSMAEATTTAYVAEVQPTTCQTIPVPATCQPRTDLKMALFPFLQSTTPSPTPVLAAKQ